MQTVNGMHYRIVGKGNPIIFIHGFLENSTMWDDITPALENCSSILIDLPGHGKSQELKKKLSISEIAHLIFCIIEKEDVSPKAIVGHSLGGYVGLELIKLVDKSVKVILLNSHPWEDSEIKKQERQKVAEVVLKNHSLFIRSAIPNLFQNAVEHQDAVKALIESAEKMNPKSIAYTSLAMANRNDNSETLINSNSIVIQGEYDKLIPSAKMQKFCKENKVELKIIEKVDHMAHITATLKVKNILRSFLKS